MAYKQALITGATSGIGMSFARALPEETNLILTGRNADQLEALRDELQSRERIIEIIAADLSTPDGLSELLEFTRGTNIDLLINNAGIAHFGDFLKNSPDAEAEMIAVNVLTPVILTRALLPGMLQRAKGANARAGVIILSSVVGFRPVPYFATYAATKAFDLLFAEALSAELKREPVDVLALCPGATKTRFFERSGLDEDAVPFVIEPNRVAQAGLEALGRKPVLVTDPFQQFLLWPSLMYRRLVLSVTTRIMRNFGK